MTKPPLIIVLAAGHGTRMKSHLPKVLHPIANRPIVGHIIATAKTLGAKHTIVVTGPEGQAVRDYVGSLGNDVSTVIQTDRLGTAHASLCARSYIMAHDGPVVILLGDAPFVTSADILRAIKCIEQGAAMSVLGFEVQDPKGYGRMVMEGDDLVGIVEHKDTNDAQKAITFCNSGVMAFDGKIMLSLLDAIENNNAQSEYYLPDAVKICRARGLVAKAIEVENETVIGINDRVQLSEAEGIFQRKMRKIAMQSGVTMTDPSSVFFSHDTVLEQDVILEPNIVFGQGVTVKSGARIKAHSHLEGCIVGENAEVGPFVRLRPGAKLAEKTKVGNFVEIKKANIAKGAKVNHLSYIGDADIGAGANIGAGTITCNYDGFLKYRTEIGANAFVGSNSSLVAPVRIEEGAYVGSGSVVTKNVPENALAVARARQTTFSGWAQRFRSKMSALKSNKD